ncbi:MAG: hypothetical protein HY431_00005, partial [Candidatus Levybacteria bacterium]|nr:hypothetical protein [Candidatus Levybacteria bacterium]
EKSIKETRNNLEKSIKETRSGLIASMEKAIKNAFADFYESIFLPQAERNDKEHQEIKSEIRSMKEDIGEYIKDHDKRITKLERITGVS